MRSMATSIFTKIKRNFSGAYEAIKKGTFIIVTCLVIFIAVSNSIIWYIELFWGASKSFWEYVWASIYKFSGENDFIMYTLVTHVWALTVFLVFNLFFIFLDLTGKPTYLFKYKIQEDKNNPVCWGLYMKAAKRVVINAVIVGGIFQLITWPIAKWRHLPCGYNLPSLLQMISHLLFYVIIEEIGFYYFHRLFHHPRLYKHIHKVHHEWTAPVSITSSYCHPLEHLIVNLAPIAAGPLILGNLFGNHLASEWLWITIALANTTIAHCGFHFPFFPSSEAHDFHHKKFNQLFGVLGILDRLHGTDDVYRQSKEYERHVVLLGLFTAKELVPDPPKKDGKFIE